jgi:hypothetical protein
VSLDRNSYRTAGALLSLCAMCTMLAGCRPETDAIATVGKGIRSAQSHIAPGVEGCGIVNYPVSRATPEMVSDAVREPGGQESKMLARVAVDATGNITHLKVVQLAYRSAPNFDSLNARAVDAMKRWHYAPTMLAGRPVPACGDVTITVDSH